MPLKHYGILKGKAIEVRPGAGQNPHYQVYIVDETTDYRIAMNVQSQLLPSELEYLVDDRFNHPITTLLQEMPLGFTKVASKPGTNALDYIRGNLFDRTQMRPLPFNLPGSIMISTRRSTASCSALWPMKKRWSTPSASAGDLRTTRKTSTSVSCRGTASTTST